MGREATSEDLALRYLAEAHLRGLSGSAPKDTTDPLSETAHATLHELRVHQIELEMQNEELQRLQRELEASRSNYVDLYELAPVGYCTVGLTGLVLMANLTAATMLGVARIVLTSRLFSFFVLKDDQHRYYSFRKALLTSGELQHCEVRLSKSDGSTFWASLSATVAQERDGTPVMRLSITDVSERKRAEELMHQNETLQLADSFNHSIMDSMGAEIAVLDREGMIIAVNEPWRLFGLENAIVSGVPPQHSGVGTNYLAASRGSRSRPTSEDAEAACLGIQAVLEGRSSGFAMEYPCASIQRPHEWFLMKVNPLAAPIGGAVISHTNISERKQVEKRLREALLLQEAILNGATHPIVVTSLTGAICLINEAAIDRLGYARQDLMDRSVTCLHDPVELQARAQEQGLHRPLSSKDEFELLVAKAAAGATSEQEWTIVRRDGGRFSALVALVSLRDDSGVIGYVFVVIDITERKKSKVVMMEALQSAERANLAKSRFMASASHDLRQPLAALSLYVGLLKPRLLPGNDELLANLQSCVSSLGELMDDLLDVSKLSAGVVSPRLTDFAVDSLLDQVVSIHATKADLKGLSLRVRGGGWHTRSDRVLLKRIVSNFVANAISFTDRGGILMACRRREGRQWIEVWDTGHGIPADKLEHVFEEFTQLEEGVQQRGSGLGLAIAAKMAAVLGLRIRVLSRPGRGSMFAVELPPGLVPVRVVAQPAVIVSRPLIVGVVDDDVMVLDALTLALQTMGHQVVAASNAKDFITRLAGRQLDIVLSDYRLAMAGTGFGVIELARSLFGPDLPAIIITGDTDPAIIRSMAGRGIAVQFKPIKTDVLQELITQATLGRTS